MNKKYRAIFFDWDGTAVYSRTSPADQAAEAMAPLLAQGVKLAVVSGTTLENIGGGTLAERLGESARGNLYFGLGRGAFNYAVGEGAKPCEFAENLPGRGELLAIHDCCYALHRLLLERYNFPSDIIFSRPNYCKIDLAVFGRREGGLYLQKDEIGLLKARLAEAGIGGGVGELFRLARQMGEQHGIPLIPTCDAKYLEVGTTNKSSNVDVIFSKLQAEWGISAQECCFWGDEYLEIDDGIYGSDSFMRTELTKDGDFFDVSEIPGRRPEGVTVVGGGVERFLGFLREQAENP